MTCEPTKARGALQVWPSSVAIPFGTLTGTFQAGATPAGAVGALPAGARAIVGATVQRYDPGTDNAPLAGRVGLFGFRAGGKVPTQVWPLVTSGGPVWRLPNNVFCPCRIELPADADTVAFTIGTAGPAPADVEVTLFFEVEVP